MALLREIEDRSEEYWVGWIDFATRRGRSIRAPRRTVFAHLLLHSIRHCAAESPIESWI